MAKFCIILVIIFWASAFVGIRHAVVEYHPFELALFRYTVASITLLIFALIKGIRLPEIKDLAHLFITGIIGISVYNISLNYGELTSTAGEACFIVNTAPLFTSVMGFYFLKEKLRLHFIVGLCISFSGVSLIALSFSNGIAFKQGAVFILVAAVAHALHFILQKPLLGKYTPIEVTCYCLWAGTISMVPFGYGFLGKISHINPAYTISVIYLGIFPAAIAYLLWAIVLERMDASKAASFLYTVPIIAVFIGWIWLNEFPSPISIIGGIIAITGVFYANKHKRITAGENLKPMKGRS